MIEKRKGILNITLPFLKLMFMLSFLHNILVLENDEIIISEN